jgi:hypothetical protein
MSKTDNFFSVDIGNDFFAAVHRKLNLFLFFDVFLSIFFSDPYEKYPSEYLKFFGPQPKYLHLG